MKAIKYLKIVCAVFAVIGCAGLGVAIFGESANKMLLVYIFGAITFIGLQASGIIALYGLLKDKDTKDRQA